MLRSPTVLGFVCRRGFGRIGVEVHTGQVKMDQTRSPGAANMVVDSLNQIVGLFQSGFLTEEEFVSAKTTILELASPRNSSPSREDSAEVAPVVASAKLAAAAAAVTAAPHQSPTTQRCSVRRICTLYTMNESTTHHNSFKDPRPHGDSK